MGNPRNILTRGTVCSSQCSDRLRRRDQVNRRTRTTPPRHPFLNEVRGLRLIQSRGPDDLRRIVNHRVGDRYPSHQCLGCDDIVTAHHRLNLAELLLCHATDDKLLLCFVRVVHEYLEQEPVLLRFGQWIGSLLFQWVLGGQHEERPR